MSDATSVNVDLVSVYNEHLASLKEIDLKLTSLKGTMAAVLKEATDTVTSMPLADALKSLPGDKQGTSLDVKAWQKSNLSLFAVNAERTVGQFVNEARQLAADAEAYATHAATDWINAHKGGMDDGAALRSRRAEVVAMAEATANVVSQFVAAGVLPKETKLAEIPKAPGKGSTSSTSNGKASAIRFYKVLEDGTKELYAAGYDLSRVAWYQPFDKCGAEALKAGLTNAGWDGTLTTDAEFEVEVTHPKKVNEDGTPQIIKATIGWTIVKPETEAAEFTPAEATKAFPPAEGMTRDEFYASLEGMCDSEEQRQSIVDTHFGPIEA